MAKALVPGGAAQLGNVVAELQAVLPSGAHSLYYRDAIGNISSSNTRHHLDKVQVQLRPRYPLLGGWKVMGWSNGIGNA